MTHPINNFQEYLQSFVNFETHLHTVQLDQFNLERFRDFMDALDNPQQGLRIVHVAGTKGKGSTCVMMASILHTTGLKVGLYTSPHVHHVNERIRVLDETTHHSTNPFYGSISDDNIGYFLGRMRGTIDHFTQERKALTYFEVLTALALVVFASRKVDIVILETGLGGRLDATNVVDSHIALITPISFDHTQLLGNTIELIAQEKCGIIKDSHQAVVVAPQQKAALDVIIKHCLKFGITPHIISKHATLAYKLRLKGKHQLENATVVLGVIEKVREMGFKIPDSAIEKGLLNVVWPGRFEILQESPTIVLDCAHNHISAKALAQTIVEEYPHRRIILVLGISKDKDIAAISKELKGISHDIILTKADHARAHQFTQHEAEELFFGQSFTLIDSLPQALDLAKKSATAHDVIVITGSIFIVAKAREVLCINTKT